jgi:ABC-type transport system involved in Fe-S cluster assembly fused permease/ATPase subunit
MDVPGMISHSQPVCLDRKLERLVPAPPDSKDPTLNRSQQFVRGRTTLMITHRMWSIALAVRLVVMDQGRIVDAGPHDELVRRCDLYSRLYALGFKESA